MPVILEGSIPSGNDPEGWNLGMSTYSSYGDCVILPLDHPLRPLLGAVPPDEVAGLDGGGEAPSRARPVSCSRTAATT